jgi:hypothetical protein
VDTKPSAYCTNILLSSEKRQDSDPSAILTSLGHGDFTWINSLAASKAEHEDNGQEDLKHHDGGCSTDGMLCIKAMIWPV